MPLNNLLENEFEFMMQANQPIDSIMNMSYWKFEDFIEKLNARNDELEKEKRKQENSDKKTTMNNNVTPFNTTALMNKFKTPKF